MFEKNSLINRWFAIDERVRFVIVGIANMGLRYLLFALFLALFSERYYQYELLAVWLMSSVWAFYLYKILVFCSNGNHLHEYLKSVAVWSLSYVINAALLSWLREGMQLNLYLAQAIVIVILVVINYLLFKHFAFSAPHRLKWWERMLRFFDIFGRDK